ncbi:LYR motif-containing protein At3g19508-like isoform X1 [Dioscorea cayenensis subsp. rotundata]|uniref:LYR motif-containing protein At3g19508-like isoform X1 n=1 Tax=Dioscorea cayennensis subsp. rotundata TaxID=55577 RepID=A0AB40CP73_DIOCR|nr:LYR motif-containing protein At3g19508-like isoform X1 [Dioscorea cayenensis subsp. rotundata]
MERAARAYRAVLRLVRRLPAETRPYYSKYARENFVNYREVDDSTSLDELFRRAYTHTTWVLNKVEGDLQQLMSSSSCLAGVCCYA